MYPLLRQPRPAHHAGLLAALVLALLAAAGPARGAEEPVLGPVAYLPVVRTPSHEVLLFQSQSGLFSIRADGSDTKQLTTMGGWHVPLAWSPDGARIAFQWFSPTGLKFYMMNSDGAGMAEVASLTAMIGSLWWSPDGKTLVYNGGSSNYGLHSMPADGSAPPQQLAARAYRFAVSPVDGTIVYPFRPTGEVMRLYLLASGSMTPTTVENATPSDIPVAWSPDGQWIAFVGPSATATYAVSIIRPDGTGLKTLADLQYNVGSLAWSPDGTRIATDPRTDPSQILIANVDGSAGRVIAPSGMHVGVPRWSPSGSVIAFSEVNVGGSTANIYTMNPDGTDITWLAVGSYPIWKP